MKWWEIGILVVVVWYLSRQYEQNLVAAHARSMLAPITVTTPDGITTTVNPFALGQNVTMVPSSDPNAPATGHVLPPATPILKV